MSLIYDDESDIAEKDEEINMEKLDQSIKEKPRSKKITKQSRKSEDTVLLK